MNDHDKLRAVIDHIRQSVDDWRDDMPSRASNDFTDCADELEAALAALGGKGEAEKPVAWWNGIGEDVTERSGRGPSVRWGADAENSGHDIPLYAGYNPVHFAKPTQPEAQGEAVCCGRSECGGECGNEWRGTVNKIEALIVAMAENYELIADEGYYSPNEHERLMLVDFAHEVAEAIEPYTAAPKPVEGVTDEMVERSAKGIFEHMSYGAPVPWVPGGNSLRQDTARDFARAALTAAQQQEEDDA